MATNNSNTNTEHWRGIFQGVNPSLSVEMDPQEKKDLYRKLEDSTRIGSYMRGLMQSYENMRGKVPGSQTERPGNETERSGSNKDSLFWDAVVISAGDESQQAWYEAQLELKKESGSLPLVPYHIIPDPPGPRIGSGGSTLHILAQLRAKFGARLDSWRILLIHAGGYSKRLPSHSCSGKIFSPLPVRTERGGPYQMLDLKLAMYLPFLAMMEPGVFITASDDIEVFNLEPERLEPSQGELITALAHPSSLYIGTTHGVYVMQGLEVTEEKLQDVRPCLEVLQKPSVDLMRERGAVVSGRDGGREEIVYSDSAFWFHSPTTNKLIELYNNIGTLDVEMCIYGDMLTCLGERKEKHYLDKLYTADQSRAEVRVKRAVADAVGDTDLAVLSLHSSKFYHLGTTQEYLHGLTNDKYLRLELNLENIVCSSISEDPSNLIQGIVLNSVIENSAKIPSDSIVEYSVIHSKISLGAKTILSNVEVGEELAIPEGFLYHTVAILVQDYRMFVTVAFHVTDDMKFSTEVGRSENLQYGGRLLERLFSLSPNLYTKETVFPSSSSASLWTAKLFSAQPSMRESFSQTVRMVGALCNQERQDLAERCQLYSMEDLVNLKDCGGILEFRKQLNKKIFSSC